MGTALDPSDIKRYEVTEVYSDPEALVDIVLVHGLNGHPRYTWTTPASKKSKKEVFWPSDLLPATLRAAKARILVYGYNADVYAFGGNASSDMIHQHAQTLLANLSSERKLEERSNVPIIWVAHSLGGILVKRALTLSSDLSSKSADDKRSIFVSTYGIIFLGTPHTGADAAKWGTILQSIGDAVLPSRLMHTEPHLVRTLKSNNETLQNINLHFLDICHNFEMNMVHEAAKTDVGGTKVYIVDQESASPLLPNVSYYGIEATHSGMCKFETKHSPGYTNVSAMLKTWVTDSPVLIRRRHEFEREARRRKAEDLAKEILDGIPTANPCAPVTEPTQLAPIRLSATEGSSHQIGRLIRASPSSCFEVEEMETDLADA